MAASFSNISFLVPLCSLVVGDKPSGSLQVQVSATTCLFQCRVKNNRSGSALPFIPNVLWEREVGNGNSTYIRLSDPYWVEKRHIYYTKFGRASCTVEGSTANCDYSTHCDISTFPGNYHCTVYITHEASDSAVVQTVIFPGECTIYTCSSEAKQYVFLFIYYF